MKSMKKFYLFVVTALVGVSSFWIGCSTEAEEKIVTNTVVREFDATAVDEAGLLAALATEGVNLVAFAPGGTPVDVTQTPLTIPAGKTVYLFGGLATADSGKGILVEGTVIVGDSGTLTVASGKEPIEVADGGRVEVRKGGTLSVDDPAADIVDDEEEPALKTGAVINGGTLEVTGTLTDTKAGLEALAGYVTSGRLNVSTAYSALKPSEAAAVAAAKPGLAFIVEANGDDDAGAAGLTIPANLTLTTSDTLDGAGAITVNGKALFSGNIVPTSTIAVNGSLFLTDAATLVNELTIGANGSLGLAANKAITLGDASAKISAANWEITPASGKTDGTVGAANVSNTAVGFSSSGIAGLDSTTVAADGKAPRLDTQTTDPTSAAVLTFGTSDSELKIKEPTAILGVILDVSTKGKIIVQPGKVLHLGLGAGANHIASGGIYTQSIATTAGNGIKANAFTPKSSGGNINSATTLATANIEKAAAASVSDTGHLGAGATPGTSEPAAATITGAVSTGTTIDANDTFAVDASNVITVTSK